MSISHRISFLAGIVCLLGVTNAQPPALPQASPFLPADAAAIVQPQEENYEFTALATIDGKTTVSIHDKAGKKSRWIPVGVSKDEIEVVRCEPATERVIVRVGGAEKTLRLRQPAAAAPTPAAPTLRRLGPAIPPAMPTGAAR